MQRFPSFHRNSSTTGIRTAREHLSDILNRHYVASAAAQTEKRHEKSKIEDTVVTSKKSTKQPKRDRMPSSKGEPTDPELREQVKEEVKAEEKGEIISIISDIR